VRTESASSAIVTNLRFDFIVDGVVVDDDVATTDGIVLFVLLRDLFDFGGMIVGALFA